MYVEGIEEYKDIILDKLKALARKLELASVGMVDTEKLASVSSDLSQIRTDIIRLKHGELTWEDLRSYNISQKQMKKNASDIKLREAEYKTHLDDFNALSEVPIKEYSKKVDNTINELYSMVEFINNNYMALFTQKLLLYSNRNNSIRESIYQHYQELSRLFNEYIEFVDSSSIKNGTPIHSSDIIHKQYLAIFKKYHSFINNLSECIENIQKDEAFTSEDFTQTVSNVDSNMRIYGLTLGVALEECKNFINEVEEYMTFINRDFFDAMNIDSQKK